MVRETYVCHESIRRSLSFSILLVYCSRRTTLQFRCVVLPKRSCGSSMGRGERASVERPTAAGRLQETVGLGDERQRKSTNVSFCSFRLTFGEERLRTQVSMRDTCSARDTYTSPVECYRLKPCHLTEHVFRKKTAIDHVNVAHLP